MAHRDNAHAPLANGAHETKTTSASVVTSKAEKDEDDDDATDFTVSDAFAKFRIIEHLKETRISPNENRRAQKPTGSKQEPTTRVPTPLQGDAVNYSFANPERKIVGPAAGYKATGYLHQSTTGNRHPMPKAEGKVNSHYDSKKYAPNDICFENGYAGKPNTEIHDVEIPITGIAKRLRHHWESKDVQDGRQHQRHPTQGHGHGQGRGTGMNTAARRAQVYAAKADVHISNGFDVKEARGDGPSYRAETSLHQYAPGKRIPGRVQEHDDVGSTWVGPLDFAQNQLAKFKQLEAIAVRATKQSHPAKKVRLNLEEEGVYLFPIKKNHSNKISI